MTIIATMIITNCSPETWCPEPRDAISGIGSINEDLFSSPLFSKQKAPALRPVIFYSEEPVGSAAGFMTGFAEGFIVSRLDSAMKGASIRR